MTDETKPSEAPSPDATFAARLDAYRTAVWRETLHLAFGGPEFTAAARERVESYVREAVERAERAEREVAELRKPPCLVCDVGVTDETCSCTDEEGSTAHRPWRSDLFVGTYWSHTEAVAAARDLRCPLYTER